MANIKISQLPTTGTAGSTDELETNTAGGAPSVRRTIAQIMAAGLASYSPSIAAGVGASAYGATFSPTLVEAASGDHSLLAGVRIAPTITAGVATATTVAGLSLAAFTAQTGTTNAAGLYIEGPPTSATNNYALWAASGRFRFDGASGHGIGTDGASNTQLYLGGTFTGNAGIYLWTTINPGVNGSAYGVRVSPSFTEAASGTHADIATLFLEPPNITNAGAATTNTATLKISGASTQGANNYALWVGAGTTRLGGNLQLDGVVSADFPVQYSAAGSTVTLSSINDSNTSSSNARMLASVAGTSAGDAFFTASISGGQNWSWGLDNSDSDKFKISASNVLGTSDALVIDPSSLVVLGRIGWRVVSVTDSTTYSPTGDTADMNTQVNSQAGGTLTMAAPSGTPVSGQRLVLRLATTNTQTLSWNAIYRGSADLALPTSAASAKTHYFGFVYNSTDSKWDLLSAMQGF